VDGFRRLQDEASRYMKKIELERAKIKEFDEQIIKYQELILDQKTRLGGVNAAQVNNQLIQKQIKVLDNRLDKCLTKFNETVAHNKSLRQKIDEYRRERIVFDGIYKKLERDLHEKKIELSAVITDSKRAYEERDRSQKLMQELQAGAQSERAEFEKDFKELSNVIKEQQELLEQLRLKQFERTNEDDAAITGTQYEQHTVQHNNAILVHPKDKTSLQEKINYGESIAKIQEVTGITDIQEIINKFLEAEDQNFSLFNYVNDVNMEIERLEHANNNMRSMIEKYRGQGMTDDTQRKKTVRESEEKLQKTEKKIAEYAGRAAVAERHIAELKSGIQSIFARIGASSVDEMLGNQGVTDSNMMQYLGIIEQKTSEILQAYAKSQMGQPNETPLTIPTIMRAEGVKLNPPNTDRLGDEENIDAEIDERPLTRHELFMRFEKEYQGKAKIFSIGDNNND
jgi:coiled-coil domain-containing protein 63/114